MTVDVQTILDAARKIDEFAQRDQKLMDLQRALGQTLADLTEHLQEQAPLVIKALSAGFQGLRIEAPPVTLTPRLVIEDMPQITQAITAGLAGMKLQAPPVNVSPVIKPADRVGWRVIVKSGQFGDSRMELEMTPITLPAVPPAPLPRLT